MGLNSISGGKVPATVAGEGWDGIILSSELMGGSSLFAWPH